MSEPDFKKMYEQKMVEVGELQEALTKMHSEAETRIAIVNERLSTKEQELQELFYDRHMTRVQLDKARQRIAMLEATQAGMEAASEYEPDKPHLVAVDDDNRGEVKDLLAGMFDLEMLAEADGFKLEGVDAEGNVTDLAAFEASLDELKESHPDVHAKVAESLEAAAIDG
jgi:hypothetical protein